MPLGVICSKEGIRAWLVYLAYCGPGYREFGGQAAPTPQSLLGRAYHSASTGVGLCDSFSGIENIRFETCLQHFCPIENEHAPKYPRWRKRSPHSSWILGLYRPGLMESDNAFNIVGIGNGPRPLPGQSFFTSYG